VRALLRNTHPVHLRLKAIVPGQYPGLAEATIDRQFTPFQGWELISINSFPWQFDLGQKSF